MTASDEKGGVNVLAVVDPRLVLDVLFASSIGFLLFSRVNEQRTLWLLRGWLFLVAMAWFVQRFANLPLTTKLVDALVMACSLSLAILWQGELRRLMELLGTGRLAVLLGNPQKEFSASAGTVSQITEAAGRLSQLRRGALIVVDLGSDLRPEDFLNPGIPIGAVLSRELMLNLFAADTPLHDGAVLVRGNRIESAGVILPLSRDSVSRFGTRHLAALGSPNASIAASASLCRKKPARCLWRTRASWNDRSPVHASRNCSGSYSVTPNRCRQHGVRWVAPRLNRCLEPPSGHQQ